MAYTELQLQSGKFKPMVHSHSHIKSQHGRMFECSYFLLTCLIHFHKSEFDAVIIYIDMFQLFVKEYNKALVYFILFFFHSKSLSCSAEH